MPKPTLSKRLVIATVGAVALLLCAGAAPRVHREYQQGAVCIRCHEIAQLYDDWHTSAHRNVPCSDCHEGVFTFKAGFHINNMRRVFAHALGEAPEKPHLKTQDVLDMGERCRQCHQEESAAWRSGRHSSTYSDIFLNTRQNQRQLLMDDCLRCHGMHYQGPIRELITPISTSGPWRLNQPQLAEQPVVPCLACHRVHREGAPLEQSKFGKAVPGPQQELVRPSVAIFDRRSMEHVAVSELPPPAVLEGTRLVKMSPDQRQALCYQCHATQPDRQANSGDDRTPTGVHEGLSCFACHAQHSEQTRASCATCHPKLSNCGIAVEKMDTTFKDKASKHNIHFVKCADCHTKGVPKKKSV